MSYFWFGSLPTIDQSSVSRLRFSSSSCLRHTSIDGKELRIEKKKVNYGC